MPHPALAMTGIVKNYGDLVAVDHVDLAVSAGEVHGLLGPNGAGKTTLMRILFGLIRPDAGRVEVAGRSPATDGVEALRGVAGFIESPRFYPYLSARQNLALLARLDRDPFAARRIDDALVRTGLADRAGDKVRGYSFGMQQRLGIAAALIRQPSLLVVDEPSNGLDPGGIRDMRQLIRDLAADGLTIVVSSHNMLEVEELCDHATIMRRGRAVFHGSMADLRQRAPDPARKIVTGHDGHAVEILRAVPGVRDVTLDDGGVRFHASRSATEAATVALGTADIGVSSLTALEAPLESLFFLLTDDDTADSDAHTQTPDEVAA